MYTLVTKSKFDSAHFLKDHQGKCANIHGHRWTVSMETGSETLDEGGHSRGMIVDFSQMKEDLRAETRHLDHCLIIEEGSLRAKTLEALEEEGFRIVQMPFRPTAENFAKYFYDVMTEKGYHVVKMTVNETENNSASYFV